MTALGTVVLDEVILRINHLELREGAIWIYADSVAERDRSLNTNGRYVVYGSDGRPVGSGVGGGRPKVLDFLTNDNINLTLRWAVDWVRSSWIGEA
jgi:hypothetical protein